MRANHWSQVHQFLDMAPFGFAALKRRSDHALEDHDSPLAAEEAITHTTSHLNMRFRPSATISSATTMLPSQTISILGRTDDGSAATGGATTAGLSARYLTTQNVGPFAAVRL